MTKNIKVEITILDIELGRYHKFPVLPSTIQYTNGDVLAEAINVVDLGNIEIPSGRDIDSFGFTSEFPAAYDGGFVVVSPAGLKKPVDYKNLMEGIKARQTPVQIIVPVLDINKRMYISSFVPEFKGMGDIHYSIMFRELRESKPKKLTPGGTTPKKGTKTAKERPKVAAKAKPKTHKVVAGNSLTGIAKQYGIKDWRKNLYEPNKKVIGSDPGKLKVGQVLKL